MYLHIGNNVTISDRNIIGIFDIDKTTVTGETRSFLSHSEQMNTTVTISDEMPKSFLVTCENKREKKVQKVYISPISSTTLNDRCSKGYNNINK